MKPLATLLLLLPAASLPVLADRIDVTGDSTAWVHTGASVTIEFGIWNYGLNNPGYSPYPTQVGLQVIGLRPDSPSALIPNTTLQYFEGFVFQGWLESLDGEISVPLHDPNAELLGLPEGSLLVMPGLFHPGGNSHLEVAVLSAFLTLEAPVSAALFGANAGNYSNAARIRLWNQGAGFTIGIGPGCTVQNAVSLPAIGGLGPAQTSGITGQVTIANPEPSTWLTLAGALAVFAGLMRFRATRSRS
ncbi:MAG: hypothetical protein ACM3S5_19920 [Rhodospirillales bacterium]